MDKSVKRTSFLEAQYPKLQVRLFECEFWFAKFSFDAKAAV